MVVLWDGSLVVVTVDRMDDQMAASLVVVMVVLMAASLVVQMVDC